MDQKVDADLRRTQGRSTEAASGAADFEARLTAHENRQGRSGWTERRKKLYESLHASDRLLAITVYGVLFAALVYFLAA